MCPTRIKILMREVCMTKKAGCCGGFDGLCCRMVIETKRVFDGCAFSDENVTLTLTADVEIPAQSTFVSARVVSSELENYTVTDGDGGCCRVCGEAVTRFAVTYANGGSLFTVGASYRECKELLLRLPSGNSLVPYTIEVQTAMSVNSGAIIGTNAVSVSGCLLQIVKVTAQVDILVPTYGYCKYPPCTGSVCRGFSGRIFPMFDGDDF